MLWLALKSEHFVVFRDTLMYIFHWACYFVIWSHFFFYFCFPSKCFTKTYLESNYIEQTASNHLYFITLQNEKTASWVSLVPFTGFKLNMSVFRVSFDTEQRNQFRGIDASKHPMPKSCKKDSDTYYAPTVPMETTSHQKVWVMLR